MGMTIDPSEYSVYVDANIPMYVAGKDHPYRTACRQALALITSDVVQAATSVEVHQEILHRYLSLRLPDQARAVSEFLQIMVPVTLPVTLADIERARALIFSYPQVPARDLLHVAVMLNNQLTRILTVDRHFDSLTEVERVTPDKLLEIYGGIGDTNTDFGPRPKS